MKYFVIEGTFKENFPIDKEELMNIISKHREYLQIGFDAGWILCSGPKAYSGGGVVLMKAESIDVVNEYLNNDPLKLCGIQQYNIVEFKLYKCQEEAKNWFN